MLRIEFIVKDNKNILYFFVGNNVDDLIVYCKMVDFKVVFIMLIYKIDFMNIVKFFDFIEKFVYIVNIDYVDKIEIFIKEKKYIFIFDKKFIKKVISEEEIDEYKYNFQVDGRKIDEDIFKKFY